MAAELIVHEVSAWSRLFARFSLESKGPPLPKILAQAIIPTTDFDKLLAVNKLDTYSKTTSGVGQLNMATVPVGKRWRITHWRAARTSENFTFTQFSLYDGASTLLVEEFGATATKTGILYIPLQLEPGWIIQININAVTVDGNLALILLYEEEKAY